MTRPPPTDTALIAIVDDDESLRLALAGLVRSAGHKPVTYASAEAFLADGPADRFACLVTDIQLPGMDGLDLLRRIAKLTRPLPAILITARTEEVLLRHAHESGALCLLRKPFDGSELLDCLDRALAPS